MVAKTHVYLFPLLSTIAGLAYLRWRYSKNPSLGSPKVPMLGTLVVGSAATIFLLHKYHLGFHDVMQDFHMEKRQPQLMTNSLIVNPEAAEIMGTVG